MLISAQAPNRGGDELAYLTRLKDLREDRDMTQTELATLLQTTQPQVVRYEQGKRDIPLDKLVLLCRYFNVSADYMLGLPNGMPYGHSKTKGNRRIEK
ncbi:MAG: helix-turn-helix transcriptional regulator [Clostridia bacterium]|nr:helix-turn-helix transcriptional regulator [Clostridia bacterium]